LTDGLLELVIGKIKNIGFVRRKIDSLYMSVMGAIADGFNKDIDAF
jgi:hypothetical protein